MDTREKLIAARVGMLALADELKNLSRACQVAGISRTHFYDIKDAFERYGRDGRPKPAWSFSSKMDDSLTSTSC